jgi:Polyketide cyclase / dehydrase and lipid transport
MHHSDSVGPRRVIGEMSSAEPGADRIAGSLPAPAAGSTSAPAPAAGSTSAPAPAERPAPSPPAPARPSCIVAPPVRGPRIPAQQSALDDPDSAPRPVPVTVWRRVDADVAQTFDVVVPVDLARIFRGYGPLPAVRGTAGGIGTWGRAGQSRTVLLADGGRMEESIVEVRRPGLFRYRVVPIQGVLRLAVAQIDGRFVFSASEAGGTVIRWTYVFRPRRGARFVVRAIAPLWRRYAQQVLERVADEVNASTARSAQAAAGRGA